MWDAFRENLLKTKKARLSVPRFRTTRLTIINHVIRHICILNEKVLPLLVSRAQALHGQAVLLWKQDNPFQDFDAHHFYDITSQHRDDNLGLFKKQWERNFFCRNGGWLHRIVCAMLEEGLKVNIRLWDIVLVLLQSSTPRWCLRSVAQNIFANLRIFLN